MKLGLERVIILKFQAREKGGSDFRRWRAVFIQGLGLRRYCRKGDKLGVKIRKVVLVKKKGKEKGRGNSLLIDMVGVVLCSSGY